MSNADSRQPSGIRPTWAQISLPNLNRNYRTIKSRLSAGAKLMALVKANAYGHGAVECARCLEHDAAADCFGVALVEEGMELRLGGISAPILCLGGIWSGQAEMAIANDLTSVIHRLDQAEELDAKAREMSRTVAYHVKVDTGLGRLGAPMADFSGFVRALLQYRNLKLDGLMTHFAEADANDREYTNLQILRFGQALDVVREAGLEPAWKHLSNSAGIHSHPEVDGNLARAGATLYGFTRDVIAPTRPSLDVRPVLSVHSRIVHLKDVPSDTPLGYGRTFKTSRNSRIATLPIGYADGLRRLLSNNGEVLVRGQRVPIVGRISMDLTICDVTELPEASLGDEAIILGQQGNERITAEDLAERINTISYEISCSFSARVPRIYTQ